MISKLHHIDFNEVPHFSKKDKAYQLSSGEYSGLYKYTPEIDSFENVINEKRDGIVDRETLVEVFKKQYSPRQLTASIEAQIESLKNPKTFTVTTAHQPVFLMGPLYMVYKIISTIRLCKELKSKYSDYNFVPVFVSGGEDHDLEEVATVHLFNKDITWQTSQTGSVGRMSTEGVRKAMSEAIDLFGNTPYAEELKSILTTALNESNSYGQFNTNIYKALFSNLGLLILNMDDVDLKKRFLPYALKELKEQVSMNTVVPTQKELAKRGIKEQAHVREINLFWFGPGSRDRIIAKGDYKYTIGSNSYSLSEIVNLITNTPENISPNVVMRPIYQEIILPNLAYVGGGGEIAYWLERLSQFNAFGVDFPILMRRDSSITVAKSLSKNIAKLSLSSVDFFKEKHQIVKGFLKTQTDEDYELNEEISELSNLFKKLSEKAANLDQGLGKFVLAEGAKQEKAIKNISGRLIKTAKGKDEVNLNKIDKIKDKLFPKGKLQERYDSFIPFYLKYGPEWFSELLEVLNPLDKRLKLIEE